MLLFPSHVERHPLESHELFLVIFPSIILIIFFCSDENGTKRLIEKYYGNMDGSEYFRPLSAAAERCNNHIEPNDLSIKSLKLFLTFTYR